MEKFTFTIKDVDGMHARPAGTVIKAASGFKSAITLIHKERKVNLKGGIFGLLGLGIRCGDEVSLEISGDDEKQAYEAMLKIFEDNL